MSKLYRHSNEIFLGTCERIGTHLGRLGQGISKICVGFRAMSVLVALGLRNDGRAVVFPADVDTVLLVSRRRGSGGGHS